MTTSTTVSLILTATLSFFSISSYAQEMDVDQADSLDFERFHTNKKNAIKIWNDKKDSEPTQAYDTQPAAKQPAVPPTMVAAEAEKAGTTAADNSGKRFEIRELYSITGSTRTGYTPNTVVQALHLQMQGFCAKGWTKQEERSVPDGDEYYLYYVFKCL